MNEQTTRNWGLDLVRVTEAAAASASRWMGLGQRDEADTAATTAMYEALHRLDINGHIVVGEAGKLGRPSPLESGQQVGSGAGPAMDIVLDPIDGRNLLAQGGSGAIAVAALAPRGTMWAAAPAIYMDKLVVDRDAAGALVAECLDAPAAWTLALVARVKKKAVRDLVVFVLDRPRHADLIKEIRAAGARVMLRSDGDTAGALLAATPGRGVDLLMGVGGVAEGVISACAIKALRGEMLGRLAPQSAKEREAVVASGLDLRQILTAHELIAGDEVYFAATGITDGPLLAGVTYHGDRAETQSMVLRSATGTRRVISTEHIVA
ncbi:MAG: class II fructose-bisphosphatase [Herpetosiphonaceae bacterium]|nr:class II fructose-bisphosphatase [Herpetosiphonaceae bacterium]